MRDHGTRGIEDDQPSAIVTGGKAIPPDHLVHQALCVSERNTLMWLGTARARP